MQKRLECSISGRVQMVMFRDFTMRNARALGLCGRVSNEEDGSVSVVAEGEEDSLKKLLVLLYTGPVLARVESVREMWSPASGAFVDFTIFYP